MKTIQQIAARFHELAQQEKWFEIQDEFFAEDIKSIDPPDSPYFGFAQGKAAVRRKGEQFVAQITAVHRLATTKPISAGNHFAVAREVDVTLGAQGQDPDKPDHGLRSKGRPDR